EREREGGETAAAEQCAETCHGRRIAIARNVAGHDAQSQRGMRAVVADHVDLAAVALVRLLPGDVLALGCPDQRVEVLGAERDLVERADLGVALDPAIADREGAIEAKADHGTTDDQRRELPADQAADEPSDSEDQERGRGDRRAAQAQPLEVAPRVDATTAEAL